MAGRPEDGVQPFSLLSLSSLAVLYFGVNWLGLYTKVGQQAQTVH